MLSVEIKIETRDKNLIFDMFGYDKVLRASTTKEVVDGVSIRFNGFIIREAIDIPQLISITLFLAKDVALPTAIGVFSAWLYDKLKQRKVEKLYIERTVVKIDRGEIEKILLEKIKKEKH